MSQPIIVCLGNPDEEYALTRHNVGWWVGDLLAQTGKARFRAGRGRFLLARTRIGGQFALLVKPTTYMNASGEALVELARTHDVDPTAVLAIADDLALPLGQLRIRAAGSAGGHNGLASLIEHLGTDAFPRLRCGIGPPPDGVEPAEFVLDPFEPGEVSLARDMAARAAAAVEMILAQGAEAAASLYNRRPPAPGASATEPEGAERPKEGE